MRFHIAEREHYVFSHLYTYTMLGMALWRVNV